MEPAIRKVSIRGFRSIQELRDFELRPLNVLIGANGAGKSNFVQWFQLLHDMIWERLQVAVRAAGGADRQLYLGPQVTAAIDAAVEFPQRAVNGRIDRWEFKLIPTADNTLTVADEIWWRGQTFARLANGSPEAKIGVFSFRTGEIPVRGSDRDQAPALRVYHFPNTGMTAPPRRPVTVRLGGLFSADGQNVAAVIRSLRQNNPAIYERLRDMVRLVAPFFDDFILSTTLAGDDTDTWLDWKQRGSDYPLLPSQLSDGTLRFICLATALLQHDPPGLVIIDEPELGLHPHALGILAALMKSAATQRQLIVATQSPAFLDGFDPADVIVVERQESGASRFSRLQPQGLETWLKDYSLGDLWRKNFLPGGGI